MAFSANSPRTISLSSAVIVGIREQMGVTRRWAEFFDERKNSSGPIRVGAHDLIISARTCRGATLMRFSWTGLILAPLLVPVLFSLVSLMGEGDLALSFLLPFIPACIVSYATTIFLFLPCLFLLSLWRPVTGLSVCVLDWCWAQQWTCR
jgi:hypothetical protein